MSDRVRDLAEAFVETVQAAVHNHRGAKGGQHVSFHGDFAHITPSVVRDLERWAREFQAALASTQEKTDD